MRSKMKLLRLSCLLLVVLIAFGCNMPWDNTKDEPTTSIITDSDINYTVDGKMFINQEIVSHININFDSSDSPQIVENKGLYIVETKENGSELWFHFPAIRGELYKISWKDSWFKPYTAGSIFVTAYEENKSTEYFPKERILQMLSSPKIISIANDGEVYIKVTAFYGSKLKGTFAIFVEKLNISSAIPIKFNSPENMSISAGELKLYAFQVDGGFLYKVAIKGSEFIGAYGDQVAVKVTALRENMNDSYFFEECAGFQAPNIQTFTALNTGKVYLAVIGAYWWEPRDVIITVNKL